MQLKVKYEKGVFKPLKGIHGLKEGQIIEISIESDMHVIAEAGGAFDFLKEEEDIYSKADIIEPV